MIDLFLHIATRRLRRQESRHTMMEYDQVERILLLADYTDLPKALEWKASLQAEGKQVVLWSFSDVRTVDVDEEWTDTRVLTTADLDFFFLPKKEVLRQYHALDTDLLMDLSQTENPVLEYLVAVSKARYRVGFKMKFPKVYDFILDIRPTAFDMSENAATLLFYLKKLRLKYGQNPIGNPLV